MEELKACNVRAMWDAVNELENAVMHPGKKKGLSTETLSIAIAATHKIAEQTRHKNAANLRAEPESKALTLEQLRQCAVEHKAIYVSHCNGTPMLDGLSYCAAIVDRFSGYGTMGQHVQAIYGRGLTLAEDDYGKTWIAYVRKPEGSEKSLTTQRK